MRAGFLARDGGRASGTIRGVQGGGCVPAVSLLDGRFAVTDPPTASVANMPIVQSAVRDRTGEIDIEDSPGGFVCDRAKEP